MVAHSHAPDPAQLRILSHLTANISKVSAPPSQAQGQQDPNQGPGLCNQTGPELVRAAHAHPPIYTHASHIPASPCVTIMPVRSGFPARPRFCMRLARLRACDTRIVMPLGCATHLWHAVMRLHLTCQMHHACAS